MSARRERTLLVGLAGIVAVLVVALVALTLSGGGKGGAAAVVPPSTVPLASPTSPPNDCASLVDNGWESLDCRVVEPGPGGLSYLIEVLPAPAYIATRVYVFRETPTGAEQVLLTAEDDNGSRYVASEVEANVAQTGEAQPVLVMGFLEGSTGDRLGVDVVRASGEIAAHLDLGNGVVKVDPNGLETWSGSGASGAYTHDILRDVGGSWWVVQRQLVGSDVVPHADNVLA